MSPVAVRCRDVAVRHEPDGPAVLRDLNFELSAGERVAVVGLNGAGKTSLLLALMGLAPHDGEIRICGERLSRRTAAGLRRRIGFLCNVPEDQLLFPTALEDAAFGLVRDGLDAVAARERARASLHALGVEHVAEHPLHHLSHGQKLRVALAGAIVTGPEVLLLDEPTAGLDPRGRRDLAQLLAGQEAAQIIATHDLAFVDELCSRVILLESGTAAADGSTTAAIRARWLSDSS